MPLPRDVGLGKDDFQKSKIFNQETSLVNYILNILLMKPGNLPSQPNIGVDINKYVQNNMETLDTETLKGLITSNCEDLIPYITNDDIFVSVVDDDSGKGILIIKIPITVSSKNEKESQVDVYYAFYRDELNSLRFNFLVDRD